MVKIGPRLAVAATPTALGPSSADDYTIIGELLEAVEQDPNAIEPRRLLAHQYISYDWLDAADATLREILVIDPSDVEANAWVVAHALDKKPEPLVIRKKPVDHARNDSGYVSATPASLNQLMSGYEDLMSNAQGLLEELAIYQGLCFDMNLSSQMADLRDFAKGRVSTVIKTQPRPAARLIAGKIKTGDLPMDTAFDDLEATARWVRNETGNEGSDDIRDAVRKRAEAVKANLPAGQAHIVDTAFMHVEHEQLGKSYQNEGNTTMLGDPISSVPRSDFWVSEDGFAWDMSELAAAIKANGGVMRNPLSRGMFSAQDVKSIVRHKSGSFLAALQAKQEQLTKGVRKETIDKLEKMARILLDDQSDNAAPSREAVDEFLAYLATLPEAEQIALQELRVPATDSHTGASFDVSIGQAVDDAKANRQCWHKTGDHLNSAAKHLRSTIAKGAKMPGAWS